MTQFVSPSKLKAFRACPRRCFDEPYTPSEATHFGTALHLAAASIAKGDAKTVEDAGAVFTESLARLDENMLAQENADRAADAIYNILNHPRLCLNPENVLDVESSEAKKQFNDGSGKRYHEVEITKAWGLRVMIDLVDVRLDGTLRILDWKSGRTTEEDDIQNACYALAAPILYPGFDRIETAYFYAEQGGNGWYDSTTWDAESLKAAKEYIGGLVRDFFEAKQHLERSETLNKNCGYCALRGDCKTYLGRTQVIPVASAWNVEATVENFPTIIDYLEQISAIKNAAEKIEDELRTRRNAVLRDNPVIHVGGRTYTKTEKTTRYEYNAQVLFNEAARILGRPPLECIDWDNTRAESVMKAAFPARGDATRKAFDEFVKQNRTAKSKSISVKIALSHEAPAQIEAPVETKEEQAA